MAGKQSFRCSRALGKSQPGQWEAWSKDCPSEKSFVGQNGPALVSVPYCHWVIVWGECGHGRNEANGGYTPLSRVS